MEPGTTEGQVILVIKVTEKNSLYGQMTSGTIVSASSNNQKLVGKVGDRNLNGKARQANFSVGTGLSLNDPSKRALLVKTEYKGPHLLETQKYFFNSGLGYIRSNWEDSSISYLRPKDAAYLDLWVGKRAWNFSAFTIGSRFYPMFGKNTYRAEYHLLISTNDENDDHFPTQGSHYFLGLGWAQHFGQSSGAKDEPLISTGHRGTWLGAYDNIWVSQVSFMANYDDIGISLSLQRNLNLSSLISNAQRARWYVKAGANSFGFSTSVGWFLAPGAKVGVKVESRDLGVLDLYAVAADLYTSK